MMCMCLGFAKLSYAQNLVVTASQTNATTNDIITFYATFYDQNSGCVDEGSVTWNFGANAVIIDGAGSGMVQVRYTSAGTHRVAANVNVNCNGGRPSRLGSTVTVNITEATYTITGRVTNCNMLGIANAQISGAPSFISTDNNGNYSFTVPALWSGTIVPIKSGYDFSPSNISTITSNQVVNFSQNIPSPSINIIEYPTFIGMCQSALTGIKYKFSNLVIGETYVFSFNGSFVSYTATSVESTIYSSCTPVTICIRHSCSSTNICVSR